METLVRAIHELTHALREELKSRQSESGFRCHAELATKRDIDKLEKQIMSKISDFVAAQKAFNDRQSAAIDSVVASAQGITGDIAELNRKITELQNSQGEVTPEDQAAIDALQAQGSELAAKAEAVSSALQALDAQTPPVVPNPVP